MREGGGRLLCLLVEQGDEYLDLIPVRCVLQTTDLFKDLRKRHAARHEHGDVRLAQIARRTMPSYQVVLRLFPFENADANNHAGAGTNISVCTRVRTGAPAYDDAAASGNRLELIVADLSAICDKRRTLIIGEG